MQAAMRGKMEICKQQSEMEMGRGGEMQAAKRDCNAPPTRYLNYMGGIQI